MCSSTATQSTFLVFMFSHFFQRNPVGVFYFFIYHRRNKHHSLVIPSLFWELNTVHLFLKWEYIGFSADSVALTWDCMDSPADLYLPRNWREINFDGTTKLFIIFCKVLTILILRDRLNSVPVAQTLFV